MDGREGYIRRCSHCTALLPQGGPGRRFCSDDCRTTWGRIARQNAALEAWNAGRVALRRSSENDSEFRARLLGRN